MFNLQGRPFFHVTFLSNLVKGNKKKLMPFTQRWLVSLCRWISLRLGNSESTVYWYSTGELYSYPQGDLLVRVEGLDVTRAIVMGPKCVHQVSRKLFVFRDKDSNEILTEYHGLPVMPVMYPYQRIAYTLEGNNLMTEVKT